MADWHIRNTASGSNDGSDWTDAWESWADVTWGVGGVVAGDTLYVAGGTYTENLEPTDSGSSGNPITVLRATTSQHGSDTGWDASYDSQIIFNAGGKIVIEDVDYITVDGATQGGIRVDAAVTVTVKCIEVNNADYTIVRNITTDGTDEHDVVLACVLQDSDNVTVSDCRFENCPNDGIRFITVDNTLVEHCYIGPRISSDSAIHADALEINVSAAAGYVEFRYNVINWAGDQVHQGIGGGTSGEWRIHGNVFTGSGSAYKLNSGDPVVGPLYFYNNLFYGTATTFVWRTNSTATLKNNVFYNATGVEFGTQTHTDNYSFDGPTFSGTREYNLSGDPTVAGSLDYRLRQSLVGENVGSLYQFDADGVQRGGGGIWDVGPYQQGSVGPLRNKPLTAMEL